MKTSITSIAKIAGGLALMAASSVAMASVTNTKHNLSAIRRCHHANNGNYRNLHILPYTTRWRSKTSCTNLEPYRIEHFRLHPL